MRSRIRAGGAEVLDRQGEYLLNGHPSGWSIKEDQICRLPGISEHLK